MDCWLSKVQLILKGSDGVETVVSEMIAGALEIHFEVGRAAKFASTHFPNGTNVTIKMKAWDQSNNLVTSQEVNVPIYNRGLVYELGVFWSQGNTGAVAANIELENMKHAPILKECNSTWSEGDLLSDLPYASACHLASHGTDTTFLDNYGGHFELWEVLDARDDAIAPPINVALVDACLVGQSNGWFQALLYPFGSGPVDRAAVGFTVLINSNWSAEYGGAFWEALTQGENIAQARVRLKKAYNELFDAQDNDNNLVQLTDTNCVVFGDLKTTLNRVYTGNDTPSAQFWYQEL